MVSILKGESKYLCSTYYYHLNIRFYAHIRKMVVSNAMLPSQIPLLADVPKQTCYSKTMLCSYFVFFSFCEFVFILRPKGNPPNSIFAGRYMRIHLLQLCY